MPSHRRRLASRFWVVAIILGLVTSFAPGNQAAGASFELAASADTTKPTPVSATIPSSGDKILLVFNENLMIDNPINGNFLVRVPARSQPVVVAAPATILSSPQTTLEIPLRSKIGFGEVVTFEYQAPGSSPIRDAANNQADNFSDLAVINNSTQDMTAPDLQTAVVESSGGNLVLTYDENFNPARVPLTSDYVVKVGGTTRAVSGVAVNGAKVTLTLATPVLSGETVTVKYTPATGRSLEDAAANRSVALNDRAVTNDSTATAPTTTTTAPTTTVAGSVAGQMTTVEASTPTSTAVAAPMVAASTPKQELPSTGSNMPVLLAVLLLALGAVAVQASRRREQKIH